jgi:hypothetical protein
MGDLVEYIRLLTCKIAYGRYDITSEMFQTKVCMNDLLHFCQVASVCPHFSIPEAYCNLFFHFISIFATSLQSSAKYLYFIGVCLILRTNIRQPPIFLDSELGKYCHLLFK